MKNLYFANTEITDGFWKYYENLVRNVTVHSVYDRFIETGRFDALKCNWKEGDPNRPHIFWDSDVAKWIEGAAYLIEIGYTGDLEKIIDNAVLEIEKNQLENGYFNSYFITLEPENIFTEYWRHELYCTGHFIEAAIAYHKATGKDKLLKCMLKNIDYIYKVFVVDQTAPYSTPGHQEIELALLKLYDYLGDEKHLKLARFFIDMRGNNPKDEASIYLQNHLPVREMETAVGHSVRACYLYTAMAMFANTDKDGTLKTACDKIFDNIVNQKMSITGGVGAAASREAFSYEYDLPNREAYNETCAAIALAMFAGAMQEMDANSLYGDIIERIYFNGFISGLSLDGDKFFYTNPLEIDLKKNARPDEYHPISQRVKVFDCSCCPPNVVRMLATIPRYAYTQNNNQIYCNQFLNGKTTFKVNGKECTLIQTTTYPKSGNIKFEYFGEDITLFVRIPEWCVEYQGKTENGFAKFNLKNGESLNIELPLKLHFIEANPNVQDLSGRYAVCYGPLVYCMEGIDNGENLRDITLNSAKFEINFDENELAPIIYIEALRRKPSEKLYSLKNDDRETFTARLIPYFQFANRENTDMIIFTMVK